MSSHDHLHRAFVALIISLATVAPASIAEECLGSFSLSDPQAVRDVESGQREVASAAWWGFNPEDSTQALQAALRSPAKKVIVPKMAHPWIVNKIELFGNKEIIFESGTEVVAKRGAFLGKGDCLFTAWNQENLTIVGNGAVLRMWREDYARAPYEKAEWRHCLSLRGCQNVTIQGLVLRESGGDGIYLGAGRNGEPNRHVGIRDVICDGNYRQGISVITAEDLLLENVTLRNTAGTPPQAGIDFEPNRPSELLVNCVMRNCLIEDNRGYAIHVYAGALNSRSRPISIRVEDCHTRGTNAGSLSIVTRNSDAEAVRGVVEVVNCRFEDAGTAGIIVCSKPVQGLQIQVKDCSIIERSDHPVAQSPILLVSRSGDQSDVGGIVLDNVVISDRANRPFVAFQNAGGVCLKSVAGTVTLLRETSKETIVLDENWLKERFPCDPIRSLPIIATERLRVEKEPASPQNLLVVPSHRLRGMARYAIFARQGERVLLDLVYEKVGQNTGRDLPVRIRGPSGETVQQAKLSFQLQTRVEFLAPRPGVYQIEAEPGPNSLRLVATSHYAGIVGNKGVIHMIGTRGRFYLCVPPNTPVGLGVQGEPPGECVGARLTENSALLWEVHGCHDVRSFVSEARSSPRKFCLELQQPTQGILEDEYVAIRGIAPILSFWPDVLFVTDSANDQCPNP
ncbi:right-handed parallel beta-helix repeat-containing protein [Thermogutta sp.]|uniref:right-handed parallel beta-helix repeat-containing protein n=1 Tax=Thermogutta sp. TaxID=1962930 RepID=UPI0032208977